MPVKIVRHPRDGMPGIGDLDEGQFLGFHTGEGELFLQYRVVFVGNRFRAGGERVGDEALPVRIVPLDSHKEGSRRHFPRIIAQGRDIEIPVSPDFDRSAFFYDGLQFHLFQYKRYSRPFRHGLSGLRTLRSHMPRS